ncbi:MAG TPA: T9SS type A sorting domain-containing protein [Saprospiraceae bacterium]|nr:T9SS type A sorting domain-containing protein [Saprospiraceae bacterium]HMQ82644.1 T9SS type A sorting domain-containing protein [Saprospiraceae bacterium]
MTRMIVSLTRIHALCLLQTVVVAMGILWALPASAQGWEASFGGNKEDQGSVIIQTSDHGYLVVGFSESVPQGQDQDIDIYLIRTDVDGTVLWENVVDDGNTEYANAALQTPDGGFLIVGSISYTAIQGPYQGYLLKIDNKGAPEWSHSFSEPTANQVKLADIAKSPDGGYLLAGHVEYTDQENDIFLIKVDETGNEQWRKIFGEDRGDQALAVVPFLDGYAICGAEDNPLPPPTAFGSDMFIYRLDSNGEVIWKRGQSTLGSEIGNDLVATQDQQLVVAGTSSNNVGLWKYDADGDETWSRSQDIFGLGDGANSIIELPDGDLVIGGYTELDAIDINFLIVKYDPAGNILWTQQGGDVVLLDFAQDIALTANGGFALAGYNALFSVLANDITLVITDGGGNVFTNYVQGKVVFDDNDNCLADVGENPFHNWLVRVQGEGKTYFGSTDENGFYSVRVDTGNYSLELIPPNVYWNSCVPQNTYTDIDFSEAYDTLYRDFPVQASILCPYWEADISAPTTFTCGNVPYTVSYLNTGTDVAEAATLRVTLDQELTLIDAGLPFVDEGNNVFAFDLGDVPFNGGGSFLINTQLDCDGVADAQAIVNKVYLTPDTLCVETPGWGGASVQVDGKCVNDTIVFTIENVGIAPMQVDKNYVVIENDLIFLIDDGNFNLDVGEQVVKSIPGGGATYRLVAEQEEGHPGNSLPTVAVEGCTEDGSGYSVTYLGQFPEDDADPFVSIDVSTVSDSINQVELQGHPKGYQGSKISATTDITYKIAFRNLGTEAVNRVVIRDTLPEGLDPSSILPGASSHPYNIEVYHTGVLKITFEEITLPPDGSAADASSYGFVEFRIAQKANNEVGTVIVNRAAITFDYFEPVMTNEVVHVIAAPTLVELLEIIPVDVDTPEGFDPVQVKAYPNPSFDYVIFEIEGRTNNRPIQFSLYNQQGQLVDAMQVREDQIIYNRRKLSAGLYLYQLQMEGKLVASGKLVVR